MVGVDDVPHHVLDVVCELPWLFCMVMVLLLLVPVWTSPRSKKVTGPKVAPRLSILVIESPYRSDIQLTSGHVLETRYTLIIRSRASPLLVDIRECVNAAGLIVKAVSDRNFLLTDPRTGITMSLNISTGQMSADVELQIPYQGSDESFSPAYALAQAISDKIGGELIDPQCDGPPSLFLAKQEWRKRSSSMMLNAILKEKPMGSLKLKLVQHRFFERHLEAEILGANLQIKTKTPLGSAQYSIPVLSLEESKVYTDNNPRWVLVVVLGFVLLLVALPLTRTNTLAGAGLTLGGLSMFALSIFLFSRFRRQMMLIPGYGGSLVIEVDIPSKREFREFLDSIEHVRGAIIQHFQTVGTSDSTYT